MTYFGRLAIGFFLITTLQAETTIFVPPSQILDIALEGQQHDSWCWAASISMAVKHLNPALASYNDLQCKIAKGYSDYVLSRGYSSGRAQYFLPTACPAMDRIGCPYVADTRRCPNCFKGLSGRQTVKDIIAIAQGCGVIAKPINPGRTLLNQIKIAIRDGNPVLGIYQTSGSGGTGGSHAVLIRGYVDYSSGSSNSLLLVNNPLTQRRANCEGCFFVIDTKADGANSLNTTLGAGGDAVQGPQSTYISMNQFVVLSKLPTR